MTDASGRPHWYPAYVGLGSNLDEPGKQLDEAIAALERLPESRLCAVSRRYRSAPMGPQDQPDFVNAAVVLLTRLDAISLLGHLQAIEIAQGRVRDREHWGPRRIDLDLLVYGNTTMSTPDLTLPHPGIAERNFVLFPLGDIAPGLAVPGKGTVARLIASLPNDAPAISVIESPDP